MESVVTTAATAGATGGDITISAQGLVDLHASDITASVAGGMGTGGDIILTAPTLRMAGGTIRATTAGAGAGGTIRVEVGQFTLTAGAQIDSSTTGTGAGGAIRVTAREVAAITGRGPDGMPSGLLSRAVGTGNAGEVVLTASTVTLDSGAIQVTTAGAGRGGDISLQARTVQLTEGALISAASTGSGDAGRVTITANDTLRSAHSAITTAANEGQGGALTLTAATAIDLSATDISATVTGGHQPGGDIVLTTLALTLTGGRITAETHAAGNAGNIILNVGSVVAQEATLTSSSTGTATGNAGTVTIRGPDGTGTAAHAVTLTGSALRTTAEGTGAGGAITVAASEALRLEQTILSATVNNDADLPGGPRGDITLTTPVLIIVGGNLAAETTGTRNAGNIALQVGRLTATEQTQLTSSSTGQATGAAGTITLHGLGGPGTVASSGHSQTAH
jgi:hypothetical protein